MKTPIEFLIEQLGEYFPDYIGGVELLVKQAKQMEKEQIIESHKSGWIDCQQHIMTIGETTRLGEEYYNQTYNQNK